jgi:hypothetical protein
MKAVANCGDAGMWRRFWRKWTVDKPAAFGDWLWDVFVVQFAAFLSQLTARQVIAFIPVLILVLAYAHRIPIPPELMLVGDVLAYIDIYSMILLVSFITRAAAIFALARRVTEHALRLVSRTRATLHPDFRHGRAAGTRNRRRLSVQPKDDDEGRVPIYGVALA